jgi:RNA polymerase subunit RPABC4/transcription elongation factor Spt4
MTRICRGCGNEVPEGQDFCYECGAWADNAIRLDDRGGITYSDMCLNCGKALPNGSEFCPYCGTKVQETHAEPVATRRRWTTMDYLSVALAVIPGFFNIFGLGQIVQRRWSKAFVYICVTIVLMYISPSFLDNTNSYWIIIALQLGVFMFSIMDVFAHVGKREE